MLSLDARKIAAERNTTVNAIVRAHLTDSLAQKKRTRDAMKRMSQSRRERRYGGRREELDRATICMNVDCFMDTNVLLYAGSGTEETGEAGESAGG